MSLANCWALAVTTAQWPLIAVLRCVVYCGGRIDRYQEMLVRGAGGAHSMLHENRLVDQAISDFLWQD